MTIPKNPEFNLLVTLYFTRKTNIEPFRYATKGS